ncbi:MAG TPA: histidine kinase, partial [Opitutaceae bacterium]|nr:histidine kinase [Opitutaceae bacterium]
MRDWRQIPLKDKVNLAMFFISSCVIIAALAAIFVFQVLALKDTFQRDLDTFARIAAVNSADAVAAGDIGTATAVLASLREIRFFNAAWIATPENPKFARVDSQPSSDPPPSSIMRYEVPVRFDDRVIGTLSIEGDYGAARGELVKFFTQLTAGVLVVCITLGWLLSRRAQQVVLRPVLDLAAATERVTRERDLSLRVADAGDDEIGLLTRRFNEMLSQIETRDRELKQARRDLASKVVALEFEIAERRRIEVGFAEVAQREEQRIANDLHDGLGQMLTGIAFKAHLLKTLLEESSPENSSLAAQVVDLANESIKQARDIAHGVAPVDIADNGLANALAQLGIQVERLTGARCAVRTNEDIPAIPLGTSIEIYRICQEAAHNAARHGHATEIDIHLAQRASAWHLEIRDNGSGLPPAEKRRDGLGLRLMAHRADRVGGMVAFVPNERGGLTVRCSFPIPSDEPV